MYKGIACAVALFIACLLWGGLSNVCANGIKPEALSVKTESLVSLEPVLSQNNEEYFVINKASSNARKALFDNHQYISQAYIEFDLRRIKSLKVSDLVAFYVPQHARSYFIVIKSIEQSKRGGINVSGYFSDDVQQHLALELTLEGRSVAGRLQTTNGEYLFRSHAQYGWIAAQYEGKKQYLKYPDRLPHPIDVIAKK
ncbi:hypothetical protein [Pseudoalteromonas luteoviolacea]|uniref:Uncharacterized protein n=1 Tax=Pseudoalteromonas luteoviolacea S4054 TaxID=1129367 RepID=A0A0F6A9N2_9GAMM|nr:hypothetical protein [Pseudoalteromonas luteoviolacea]AOT10835.1 hypothetical protein S4054249_23605 [Pseudoalteromonas luteoviolacea]AOT16002.1 hypothetical protein S40542_24905 [Pseudoalteromonas luteoviolacea]AOT20657.1 hypothetical protein S4054_23525 [Pseudoalteromonas luteoviolacea]KKE82885.1 hypothetical protein N479_16565 [Pseudoalteromonas luteoviolacea S4054]KZN75234.1 hypothetical protein N481_07920 [Pseudoalteromonas luteoviolacea S4047-1]